MSFYLEILLGLDKLVKGMNSWHAKGYFFPLINLYLAKKQKILSLTDMNNIVIIDPSVIEVDS